MEQGIYTHDDAFSISITNLSIRKLDDPEKVLELYGASTEKIGDSLLSLTIKESILSPSIIGSMIIKEPGHMIDDFQLTGQNEIIHIEMNNPTISNSSKKLEFCVTEVHRIDDISSLINIYGGTLTRNYYKINFCSCESYYYNMDILGQEQNAEFMNKDRFLKIAKGKKEKKENNEDEEGGEEEKKEEGLVDTLAPKYFNGGKWHVENPMDIEETSNSIWLKANANLYPWGKESNQMSLMQLMTNLTENAIDAGGRHANFLFWNDFDGWHFKSIAQMIKENKNGIPKSSEGAPNKSKPYVYQKSDGATNTKSYVKDKGDPRILQLSGSIEYDHLGLWQNGGYSSYYEIIKPNYSDPYFNYINSSSSHKTKLVDYSYQDVWPEPDECLWETVETFKILPSKIDTKIDETSPNKSREMKKNEIYGYFSSMFNNNNSKNYDYLASRISYGKFGKQNNVMWQTMLDQTDLNLSKLEKIYKDIINPTKENYAKYLHLKNLKEKWNVYRHSICCDKQDIGKSEFLAVIEGSNLIQDNDKGGIYEYTWREVEMWPTGWINDMDGEVLTVENAPITIVAIENGLSGVAESEEEVSSNAAYNLNEMFNVQDGDDVFVGPGVNVANGEINDYPEGFQMMAVGSYFRLGANTCENGETYSHKQLVKMYKMSGDFLETITPDTIDNPPEGQSWVENPPTEIYFFDVPNAHDGACKCGEDEGSPELPT